VHGRAFSFYAAAGRHGGEPGDRAARQHFDVVLDRTHWLTFGYERPRLTVLLGGGSFFTLSKDGTNVAVFPQSGRLTAPGSCGRATPSGCCATPRSPSRSRWGAATWCCSPPSPMFRGWWRASTARAQRRGARAGVLTPTVA
jgi:hypothetical protein